MEGRNIYPIGDQSFVSIRSGGFKYVDKTMYVERLVSAASKYYFLARPRRFGKSLFLDTIKCFFEGRRELFHGLYVDSIDWDWKAYPVLKIDLNSERYNQENDLDNILDRHFHKWEEMYGVTIVGPSLSVRFANIIEAAHESTGLPVVILVDEYDKPLVSNLNNNELLELYRSKLGAVYSNFKSAAEHIRMVFLTCVSRFSKLSVFSDLNNIRDVSFSNEFADICGISEAELHANFRNGITEMSEMHKITYDEMSLLLKKNYDGYKFAIQGSEMYNPWSVLNALAERVIANYWSQTGMPTLIAEALKREHADLEESFNSYCTLNELQGYDLMSLKPQPILYQAGYLTIKEYDSELNMLRLGIPNAEVEQSLFDVLLPYYSSMQNGEGSSAVAEMIKYFKIGRPDQAMRELQTFFAGVSYKMKMENENNFQNAFYLLTRLLGLNTQAEVTTSQGRIDILIETVRNVFVIELKYDGNVEQALAQIKERNYCRRFQTDTRKIYLIGANFSSTSRCIEDWKVEVAN